ncbi:hypothetical protein NQZ68_007576 [Dissostichus eleginoides]|nr:hypothetical protein NQZ68_007576 [Dissostichus eleginoides]
MSFKSVINVKSPAFKASQRPDATQDPSLLLDLDPREVYAGGFRDVTACMYSQHAAAELKNRNQCLLLNLLQRPHISSVAANVDVSFRGRSVKVGGMFPKGGKRKPVLLFSEDTRDGRHSLFKSLVTKRCRNRLTPYGIGGKLLLFIHWNNFPQEVSLALRKI